MELIDKVNMAFNKLDMSSLESELAEMDAKMQGDDFWSNSATAQKISKEQAKLKSRIEPWLLLKDEALELQELSEMGEDVKTLYRELEIRYQVLSSQLKFDGQYDSNNAFITIQSGAGGTDAQDWAEMLLKMYLKWVEKSDQIKSRVIDESPGEEAGIKSATIEVIGDHAYGRLRQEHGVHRLVRISPFNSGGTRETSFAMIQVAPIIENEEIQIDDSDLRIDTFRASGNGGQSVNTTDSAVRITHLPTQIVVSMQNEKSQTQNRAAALKVLMARLTQLREEQQAGELSDIVGPNQDAAWGNQIRNYVLHPYKLVKNVGSKKETTDVEAVLDGQLDLIQD